MLSQLSRDPRPVFSRRAFEGGARGCLAPVLTLPPPSLNLSFLGNGPEDHCPTYCWGLRCTKLCHGPKTHMLAINVTIALCYFCVCLPPLLNCSPTANSQWVRGSDSGIKWNQVQTPALLCTQQGPASSPIEGGLNTRGAWRTGLVRGSHGQGAAGLLHAGQAPRCPALGAQPTAQIRPVRSADPAELGWSARGTEAAPTREAPELNLLLSLALKIAVCPLSRNSPCPFPHMCQGAGPGDF